MNNVKKEPKNLDDMVDILVASVKKEKGAEKHVRQHGPSHHGTGTRIRNEYNLWWNDINNRFDKDPTGKPPLVQWFNERDVFMGDDMSGIINEALQARLKGEPYDITPTVERYKKHWKGLGFTDGIYNPSKKQK